MKNVNLWCSGLLAVAAGLWLSGCATRCHENQKAGLATIVCQPMDVTVTEGKTATFEVKAIGRDLGYQWCFNGEPIENEKERAWGTRSSCLKVPNVGAGKLGFYSCEIESKDCLGIPVRTRTRAAALGYTASMTTMYPPQHQPMPPGVSGTNKCGAYCGYVNFSNGGAGFSPASGNTIGLVEVQVGGVSQPQAKFNVIWRVSGTEWNCATNVIGSATQKAFPCGYPKKYFFTVYFPPGNCPRAGTDVVLVPGFS